MRASKALYTFVASQSSLTQYTRRGSIQSLVTHEVVELWEIFNGTDTFIMQKNKSMPGGWHCGRNVSGIPKAPLPDPWSYVVIDAEAISDGTEPRFDGVADVARYRHDRPKKGIMAPGNMTWHVDPAVQRLLRTSYVHMHPRRGNMSGERDFSANWTTVLPPAFTPPPDVVCHLPKHAYVPANDRQACMWCRRTLLQGSIGHQRDWRMLRRLKLCRAARALYKCARNRS